MDDIGIDGSQQRIRTPISSSSSASRESDFAKLTEVLSGIVSAGSRRSNYVNDKILPEFDPDIKNVSANDWVYKVNVCGEMYDWDNKTKLYLSILKLKGNAKLWYDGLQNSLLTWEVFSLALVKQFPVEESFGEKMEDAVTYKSTPGQDLQKYCFTKLGKINRLQLDLSEGKLVDLIARGIHDETVRTIVLAARCKTVADLNKCLSVFPNSDRTKEIKDSRLMKTFKRSFSSSAGSEKVKAVSNSGCFKCGKTGHLKRFCPKLREFDVSRDQEGAFKSIHGSYTNKCTFCNMVGHTEDKCYRKNNKKKETTK